MSPYLMEGYEKETLAAVQSPEAGTMTKAQALAMAGVPAGTGGAVTREQAVVIAAEGTVSGPAGNRHVIS